MIKFAYFKITKNNGKTGYIVGAMERPGFHDSEQKHKVSFAFCSPKDTFVKARGRLRALRKMSREDCSVFIHKGKTTEGFINALITLPENKIPSWAKSAVKKQTFTLGLKENPLLQFSNEELQAEIDRRQIVTKAEKKVA